MGAFQSYVTLASEFEPKPELATEPKKSEQEQLLAEIVALKQEIEQWREREAEAASGTRDNRRAIIIVAHQRARSRPKKAGRA